MVIKLSEFNLQACWTGKNMTALGEIYLYAANICSDMVKDLKFSQAHFSYLNSTPQCIFTK